MAARARPRRVFEHRDPETGFADTGEVAQFAAELPISHLLCRELSHNWRPWLARKVADSDAFERAIRCTRCRTERWQVLTRTGAVHSSKYVYPDGYLHEGLGRIVGEGRDALRLESLIRALGDEQAKTLSKAG